MCLLFIVCFFLCLILVNTYIPYQDFVVIYSNVFYYCCSPGMPLRVDNAKIAFLDIDLRKSKMALGVQVVITDPKQLEAIRKR